MSKNVLSKGAVSIVSAVKIAELDINLEPVL